VTLRFPLPERLIHRLEDEHAHTAKILPLLAELSGWAANHQPDTDGYPSGGLGDGGSRSTDGTSSTERAAETLAVRGDQSSEEIERIIEGALAGYEQLRLAASRLNAYVTPRQVVKGRANQADICPACDKATDKVKAGYCPTCHRQWCREGRPDRAWFVRRRKGERDAQAKAAAKAS